MKPVLLGALMAGSGKQKDEQPAATSLELADALQSEKRNIIGHWLERVLADPKVPRANQLAKPTLVDHIPDFLDELVKLLRDMGSKGDSPEVVRQALADCQAAKEHARVREWEGYAIPEALVELAHLRTAILESCAALKMTPRTMIPLHAAIDHAMAMVSEEIAIHRAHENRGDAQSEKRLQLLIANVKDYGIFTTSPDGRIQDWSQGAEHITGYQEAEIVGMNARIFFTPEDREAGVPEKEMQKAATEGKAEDIRWHMRRDGSRFWATGVTTALRDDKDQLIGFSKIFRDETARKRFEEDLLASKAELSRVNHVKDVFIATLSHELRTPLGVISGYVDLLKSGEESDDANLMREAVDAIERNVKIQIQLVNDLLDVSRIIAGKLDVDMRLIELGPVIEGATANVQTMAKAKHIQIRVINNGSTAPILGDPARLQQVLWNLLTNAIKFSPNAGFVDVTVGTEKKWAVITVKDQGRGIPADLLPYIFDRFRQADDKTNRRHGGLGLGLALVRHLVELHHGTVEAQSAGEGKGATMTVRLPLVTG